MLQGITGRREFTSTVVDDVEDLNPEVIHVRRNGGDLVFGTDTLVEEDRRGDLNGEIPRVLINSMQIFHFLLIPVSLFLGYLWRSRQGDPSS